MELKDNAAAYCEAQLREIRIEAESLNRLIGKMSDQVATDGSRSFFRNLRAACEETEKLAAELSRRIDGCNGASASERSIPALDPELLS